MSIAVDTSPTFTTACFRERVVRELADIQDARGRMPTELVEDYAGRMGVHADHLRRIVRQFKKHSVTPKADRKSKKTLPDETAAKVAYFKHGGDANAALEDLQTKNLHGGMVLRTFQRRIHEWDACLRACAKGGHRAMVKHQFYNREHQPYRTYVYATDHSKLPIRVIPDRGTKPVFPWLSILMDLKTRVILVFVITSDDPVTEDTLSLLAEGIRGRDIEGRGFLGGMPEFLRTDRGGDYISNALALGLVRLDITHQFTEAYSSFQNGRVERVHRRVDSNFAPTQVGFQAGGEDEYTKRVRKTVVPDSALDSIRTLRTAFKEWVETYNNTPHRALGGRTPLEAWFSDPHPVKKADHKTVAYALMRSKTLTLQKYGIDFRSKVYSSSKLARLFDRGVETVEVRYYANDETHVEVFCDGEWVCTATRSDRQSEEEKAGVVSHRKAQTKEAERTAGLANYEKALDREEYLRTKGIPETEWPTRPPKPGEEATTEREPSQSESFPVPTAEELNTLINKNAS